MPWMWVENMQMFEKIRRRIINLLAKIFERKIFFSKSVDVVNFQTLIFLIYENKYLLKKKNSNELENRS